ncbi:protein ALTERED PHOSPHATE STARVATION RESPONSE 1 isoform X2 [Telopea speciosissima]|uniref:protein ALTERED PHOSPHATE STARVATION RESPONSE 1 isoform X2 n=1 Tax=Telopea speciosissima TaxID=54955 RepID=UPI001CC4C71E|nr:protein ALTERED PHOSPHATE STARVATION RESPONSE 1 isoform X2 [Telopea speciosissima]
MGCTSSKVDDLPAVALCRERCHFLEVAIRQRYAFADAHVAYIHSLKGIGVSLHRVFDQDLDSSTFSPPSPVFPLPTQRKGDPVAAVAAQPSIFPPPSAASAASAAAPALARDSNSNSGSHIHFHSDSEDDDDDDDDYDSGSLHHSGHSSPLHHHYQPTHEDHQGYPLDQGVLGSSFPGGFMTMNYMRNRPTPSVSYEQRPMSPDIVRMDESSSSYYPYPYPNQNPAPPPYYAYSNYEGFYPYGSSSSPPPPMAPLSSSASSSKPPPPPPSPPRNSPWDFLNPFGTFERYYPPYTPSRDSKEVREEEGIPDLEDEDYQQEVVKEVHGDRKFVDGSPKKVTNDEDVSGNNDGEATHYQTRPSVSSVEKGVEYDAHLVDKNVVINEERSEDQGNVATYKARVRLRGASEVVAEIKIQFERAAESGSEVSRMLEAGKLPYHRKNAVYQVSSKMLHVITPSTSKSSEPSSSTEKSGSAYLAFNEDTGTRSSNLSSTLQKLNIWEKKLYDEVKAEEKMRVLHDRKRQRLKRLDEKGAEAHKVDSTRTLVRTLSTKIRIAIQVVDKISVTINKLRDEELWPQINELIHGLVRMWKLMLECHRNQCQAITEAKNLDAIVSSRKFSIANLEAAMQLEHEVLNWISNFSNWIGAQKGYITALNSWLLKCIFYEPEETPDGIVPFSPGRMGAPPVFVICNQWSQAMERISEKEVVDAMLAFALGLRHNIDLCRRMMTTGDMESKVKTLEREEQKMQKAMQALDKKIVMVSGQGTGVLVPEQIVHQSNMGTISSLQSGLKQIFDAMERFTASSMEAYEELRVRIEEDRIARENAKVP